MKLTFPLGFRLIGLTATGSSAAVCAARGFRCFPESLVSTGFFFVRRVRPSVLAFATFDDAFFRLSTAGVGSVITVLGSVVSDEDGFARVELCLLESAHDQGSISVASVSTV